MKHKILTILCFIAFAVPIPIAAFGCLFSIAWGMVAVNSAVGSVIIAAIGIVISGSYIITYVYSLSATWKEKTFSYKTFLPMLHCFVAGIYLVSTVFITAELNDSYKRFNFRKKDFSVVYEDDTHSGFHGDGTYYLKLDCSQNKEKAMKNLKDWKELPMPLILDSYMFNGGMGLADDLGVPEIVNGYYMFEDRHSESTDPTDESQLRSRASYNFSVGIYDSDTDTFYFISHDT